VDARRVEPPDDGVEVIGVDGEPGVYLSVEPMDLMVGDPVGVGQSVGLARRDGVDGAPGAGAQVCFVNSKPAI
jgi:hypothetical protein